MPASRVWFLTENGQPVDWATAVAGGAATVRIVRAEEWVSRHGARRLLFPVWRQPGDPVTAAEVTAAQAEGSTDPVPQPQPEHGTAGTPPRRPSYARVVHGSDATVPRPDADHVDWEGQVTPQNMLDGDRYDEVAASA